MAFSDHTIRKIAEIVINENLSRSVLWAGIDSRFMASVHIGSTNAEQLLLDLFFLNSQSAQGQPAGLESWLANAITLVRSVKGLEALNGYQNHLRSELRVKKDLESLEKPPEERWISRYLTEIVATHSSVAQFGAPSSILDIDEIQVELDLFAPWASSVAKHDLNLAPSTFRFSDCLSPKDNVTPENWANGRWVVLGEPGSGKTTLFRRAAFVLAASPKMQPGSNGPRQMPLLPIFLRLSQFEFDLMEMILERTNYKSRQLSPEDSFSRLCGKFRVVLLMDGLDEAQPDERRLISRQLRAIAIEYPEALLFVSSRPSGFESLGTIFREVTISPLSAAMRRKLCENLLRDKGFSTSKRSNFISRLESDQKLWDLCRNPLLLSLLTLVAIEKDIQDLNRAKAFECFITLLLDSRHRSIENKTLPILSTIRRLLQGLAFSMTKEGLVLASAGRIEQLLHAAVESSDLDRILERPEWGGDIDQFINDLSYKSGLLIRESHGLGSWRFWHRGLQEGLAAEKLHAQLESGNAKQIVELVQQSKAPLHFWREPITLLAGRLSDASELIEVTYQASPVLGIAALKDAQRVELDTISKLLQGEETKRWRREILLCLPRVSKDLSQMIEFLWRFVDSCRAPNDLYTCYELFTTILGEAPTAQFRNRFFRHLPSPDLLEQARPSHIDCLWVDIEPGNFEMGGQPPCHPDELPRREVCLSVGFQVLSIPVTTGMFGVFTGEDAGNLEKDLPITEVNWFESQAFALWLGGSLPTEAQWEYCYRSGSKKPWISGMSPDGLSDYAWYGNISKDAEKKIVGQKLPNALGLFDIAGNVWEWCYDTYQPYSALPKTDPAPNHSSSVRRVMRGGSYWTPADRLRASFRSNALAWVATEGTGFRVVRTAPSKALVQKHKCQANDD